MLCGSSEKDSRDESLVKTQRTAKEEKETRTEIELALLGNLCGLSECNERAREKAWASRKDAENSERQEK
jgi:hypothetical protein